MIDPLLARDVALRDWWMTHAPSWLDGPMWLLSAVGMGGSIWLLIALLIALFAARLRPAAWQVVLAVILMQAVTDVVLKPIVQRPRPFVTIAGARVVGTRPVTPSFPSGHASVSFAAATVLAAAFRTRGRVLAFALAALIAVSRVHIGVHYPLDILAGALLGIVFGVIVTGGRAWYSGGSSLDPHRVPR